MEDATRRPVAAALAVTACALGLAVGDGAAQARTPLPPLDTLFLDEDVSLRFRRALGRNAALGAFRLLRASDRAQVEGTFVRGRILADRDTGGAVVVSPAVISDFLRVRHGVSFEAAVARTDRFLRRVERSGRIRRLRAVERHVRSFTANVAPVGVFLGPETIAGAGASLPPGDGSEPQWRALFAGDDALWRAHLAGDPDAYLSLSLDAPGERFARVRFGLATPASQFRSRVYRRVLVNRRDRATVTFLPRVPSTVGREDAGLEADTAYEIVVARSVRRVLRRATTGLHRRIVPRDGTLLVSTTGSSGNGNGFSNPDGREGGAEARPRPIAVTPPNGETFVDPRTDWEDPDDAHTLAPEALSPFRVRVRFAGLLDPATVTPANCILTKTAVRPGTVEERAVQAPVAVSVRLEQTRLGDVVVELTPAAPLDPGGRYQVLLRLLRSLGGERMQTDNVSSFETAPLAADPAPIDERFALTARWSPRFDIGPVPDAGARLLDGRVEAAFNPPDGLSSQLVSPWYDTHVDTPGYAVRYDDAETPEVDGTLVVDPVPGGSVRILARTAPVDVLAPGTPSPSLITPWVPIDEIGLIDARRFVQFRVVFELPADYPAEAPLPYVGALVVDVSQL